MAFLQVDASELDAQGVPPVAVEAWDLRLWELCNGLIWQVGTESVPAAVHLPEVPKVRS